MKMTSLSRLAVLALLGTASPLLAIDPDLPYSSGSTGADGALDVPASLPNRYDFATAYDSARNEIVLFGGWDRGADGRTRGYRPETYTFDGTEWTKEEPNTFVAARYDASMVYDPVRQQVVMFGGTRADNVKLNETLVWNGTDWALLTPATSPSPRSDHQMVWDPVGQRVLLFGGNDGANWLEDLWAWNGTTWTQVATNNTPETNFTNQQHGMMVWDTAGQRLVYYHESNRKTYAFSNSTWTEVASATTPNIGAEARMVYDEGRNEILATALNQTWVLRNDEWEQLSPETNMLNRDQHGMVFNTQDNKIYVFGGNGPGSSSIFQDTRSWDGTTWTPVIGRNFTIDLAEKADGVFNYTTIDVPPFTNVRFISNAGNTPVTWLASGEVNIQGFVSLNGQNAPVNGFETVVAKGGPGGFDGGRGGVRFDVSGRFTGTAGQGPGGGASPTASSQRGAPGQHQSTYGNVILQPLVGGSGGGGGSSNDTRNGGNGGGGGGAILIASSRDINIDGGIFANGGEPNHSGASWGGHGAGGAVRLVADRVTGSGQVRATGPSNGDEGRVRIEAFFRPFVPNASPTPTATAPVAPIAQANQPTLKVTSVSGVAVADPPTGDLASPDVVFTEAGTATITVTGTAIPTGTPVTLRITSADGVLNLPSEGQQAVTLSASGTASFTAVVPKGPGTVQAFAEFTITQ